MPFWVKNARLVISASLFEAQKEMRELIHRHQGDAESAAQDIMTHPKHYPYMASFMIPVKFFQDKIQSKDIQSLIDNLERELTFYAPLAPGGIPAPDVPTGTRRAAIGDVPKERQERSLAFQGMHPSIDIPVNFTQQDKDEIHQSMAKLENAPDFAENAPVYLWRFVNTKMLKKLYEKLWNSLGTPGGPLTKVPAQYGWKTACMARRVVAAYLKG